MNDSQRNAAAAEIIDVVGEAYERMLHAIHAPALPGDLIDRPGTVNETNISAICRLANWHLATATRLVRLAGYDGRRADELTNAAFERYSG